MGEVQTQLVGSQNDNCDALKRLSLTEERATAFENDIKELHKKITELQTLCCELESTKVTLQNQQEDLQGRLEEKSKELITEVNRANAQEVSYETEKKELQQLL